MLTEHISSYIIVCSTCIPYANSWHLWLKIYPHVHLRHSADEGDDITCISYWMSTIQVISLLVIIIVLRVGVSEAGTCNAFGSYD